MNDSNDNYEGSPVNQIHGKVIIKDDTPQLNIKDIKEIKEQITEQPDIQAVNRNDDIEIKTSSDSEISPSKDNELIEKLKELFDATEYKIN